MKKIVIFLLFFSASSHASLIDRGNGMIYDTSSNLTWLQDANYSKTSGYDTDGLMTWASAMQWAENLVFGGFDDWRLPLLTPINGSVFTVSAPFDYRSIAGYTDTSFNANPQYSEMASLFYALVGIPLYDTDGSRNSSYGFSSVDPFFNISSVMMSSMFDISVNSFFTGTMFDYGNAFAFSFSTGYQGIYSVTSSFAAMAVREGDVLPIAPISESYSPDALPISPIPEPYTPLLMGIGLIVLSVICKAKPSRNRLMLSRCLHNLEH